MKRILSFEKTNGVYQIIDNGEVLFDINSADLKFDSFKFYEGLYAKEFSSTNIELINNIPNGEKGGDAYVYKWVSKVISAITEAFPENNAEDEPSQQIEYKTLFLFDLAVCAGIGDYVGEEYQDGEQIQTTNLDADYAVKISGHSMEPTYPDGCIVLVQNTVDLNHDDVCIVNIDGKSMCKRIKKSGKKIKLVPDNKSGEFPDEIITEEMSCNFQGKVLGQKKDFDS